MEQIKVELENLKEEEIILRKKLESTEDTKLKAELKTILMNVLKREQLMAEILESGVLPPPASAKKLEEEYKILSEKEEVLRTKLDKVTDPKVIDQLKAELVAVLEKQEKIETLMAESNGANGSNGVDLELDNLKKEYMLLDAKAEDLRKQIKNTDDPDIKAKCKQMLTDILKKQEQIKEKAESLKAGKEEKKIK